MVSKSPLLYMARKGLWEAVLVPVARYAMYQAHSHRRPVEQVGPGLLPEDTPSNKVVTKPRLGEK